MLEKNEENHGGVDRVRVVNTKNNQLTKFEDFLEGFV